MQIACLLGSVARRAPAEPHGAQRAHELCRAAHMWSHRHLPAAQPAAAFTDDWNADGAADSDAEQRHCRALLERRDRDGDVAGAIERVLRGARWTRVRRQHTKRKQKRKSTERGGLLRSGNGRNVMHYYLRKHSSCMRGRSRPTPRLMPPGSSEHFPGARSRAAPTQLPRRCPPPAWSGGPLERREGARRREYSCRHRRLRRFVHHHRGDRLSWSTWADAPCTAESGSRARLVRDESFYLLSSNKSLA